MVHPREAGRAGGIGNFYTEVPLREDLTRMNDLYWYVVPFKLLTDAEAAGNSLVLIAGKPWKVGYGYLHQAAISNPSLLLPTTLLSPKLAQIILCA